METRYDTELGRSLRWQEKVPLHAIILHKYKNRQYLQNAIAVTKEKQCTSECIDLLGLHLYSVCQT